MMMPFDTALMSTDGRDRRAPTDDERVAAALCRNRAKAQRRDAWSAVVRRLRALEARVSAVLALF